MVKKMLGNDITFTQIIDNSNKQACCDICGLPQNPLLQSEPFDNGNASQTVITFCEPCTKNLSKLFIILKKQKEEK